jgi:hypothetical protein
MGTLSQIGAPVSFLSLWNLRPILHYWLNRHPLLPTFALKDRQFAMPAARNLRLGKASHRIKAAWSAQVDSSAAATFVLNLA